MIFKTLKCQGSKRVLPLVSACLDVRPQPHPPFCLLHVTLGWKTFDFISQSLNLIKEIIFKSSAVFNLFIQPLFTSSCGKDDKLSSYGGQLTFFSSSSSFSYVSSLTTMVINAYNEGGISRRTIKRSKPAQNLRLEFSNWMHIASNPNVDANINWNDSELFFFLSVNFRQQWIQSENSLYYFPATILSVWQHDEEPRNSKNSQATVKTTRINPVSRRAEPFVPAWSRFGRHVFTGCIFDDDDDIKWY